MPVYENLGSLITFKNRDEDCCLGYLIVHKQKDKVVCLDAHYGRIDITEEHAKAHNDALDKAIIEGLTKTCRVGEGQYFYLRNNKGVASVVTFLGTRVNDIPPKIEYQKSRVVITFHREPYTFVCHVSKKEYDKQEALFFKRIR